MLDDIITPTHLTLDALSYWIMSGIGGRINHFLKKRKKKGSEDAAAGAKVAVVVKDSSWEDLLEPPIPPPKDDDVPKERKEDYGYVMDSLKKGKWAEQRELLAVRDPAERVRIRMEMQEQKEEAVRMMVEKEEEERERVWRRTKELLKRREEKEAELWQARIREKAVQDAAERRRRVALEKAEDEQQAREKVEKRTAERQRRAEAREAWEKKNSNPQETNLQQSPPELTTPLLEVGTDPVWATIQTQHNGVWKRRYCVFETSTLRLYRAVQDTIPVLEVHGSITALREPEDGFEELSTMPHSFVVEFTDRRPWAVYTDSGEDKVGNMCRIFFPGLTAGYQLQLLALLQRCRVSA